MAPLRSAAWLACVGLILTFGCSPREEPPPPSASTAPAPPPAPPRLPAPPPPLNRAEILAAAATAADAFAAGSPYPDAAAGLAGRRFSLAIPFGCGGASSENAPIGFRYDEDRGVLELRATPEVLTEAPWAAALAEEREFEAVEGFWIARPWLSGEACPAMAAAETATPPEQTLALAQVFESGGSRLLRREGKPYQVTSRIDAAEAPGPFGYRLVLQGRIAGRAQPIRCQGDNPDRRPLCVVEVELDRVAFEKADGKTVADWRA